MLLVMVCGTGQSIQQKKIVARHLPVMVNTSLPVDNMEPTVVVFVMIKLFTMFGEIGAGVSIGPQNNPIPLLHIQSQ